MAKGGCKRKKISWSPGSLLDRNTCLLPSTVTPYVTPLLLRNPDDLLLFETAKRARRAAADAKAKTAAKVRAAAVAAATNVRAVAAAAELVVHALPGGEEGKGEKGKQKAMPLSVPEIIMPPPLIVNGEGRFRQSQQQPLQQHMLLHHIAVISGDGEKDEGEGRGGAGGAREEEQGEEILERNIMVSQHQEERSQKHQVGFPGMGDMKDMQIDFPRLAGEIEHQSRCQRGEGVLATSDCRDITCVVAV